MCTHLIQVHASTYAAWIYTTKMQSSLKHLIIQFNSSLVCSQSNQQVQTSLSFAKLHLESRGDFYKTLFYFLPCLERHLAKKRVFVCTFWYKYETFHTYSVPSITIFDLVPQHTSGDLCSHFCVENLTVLSLYPWEH